MNGLIKKDYNGTKWLSYLGVQFKKGKTAEALKSVTEQLDQFKYADSYMHGTSATALLGIEKVNGRLAASKCNMGQGGARQDFGNGFYCFKGELNYALSFAIDRSWPIFEGESFSKHNSAVILFLKPRQFTKGREKELVCHVGKQKPIEDKHLKEHVLPRPMDYTMKSIENLRRN